MRMPLNIWMLAAVLPFVGAASAHAQFIPPAFGLPVVGNAQPSAPPPEPQPAPRFSYGENGISLFYTTEQVDRMKRALEAHEGKIVTKNAEPVEEAPVVEKVDEPTSYPVFYLTTIMYRSANDWSIWVSGFKITAQKNTTDLTVTAVTPDSVTFNWKPGFTAAFQMRSEGKNFADPGPLKNRLQTNSNIVYNPETGIVTFTLHQNQSFSVGHYAVFEGYVEPPVLEQLLSQIGGNDDDAPAMSNSGASSRPVNNSTMEDPNVRNMKNIMRNMPQVNLPNGERMNRDEE